MLIFQTRDLGHWTKSIIHEKIVKPNLPANQTLKDKIEKIINYTKDKKQKSRN